MISNYQQFVAMLFAMLLMATAAQGQTGFTYQGRLTDGGTSANGNYDLQFALWNSSSGGAQVGSTQTLNTVAVSNGVFTVTLDFGANAFPGANRFLEISARPSGGGSFTLLSPRQPITPTPYAIRSLNASSADSVPASGVSAGSGNYIQNTSSPQAASNFNISGNGTVGGNLIANGNVGIGTTAPTAKLSVIATGDGARVLHLGTDRAWVFKQLGTGAGTALELTGADPNNNNKHFVINTDGNVGIGTTAPVAKLHVGGNVVITGVGTGTAQAGLDVGGNATQSPSAGGFVKAMIYVKADGSIDRCYNSQTTGSAMTTPPCGFSIIHNTNGIYRIDFGFSVKNRFFSVTPDGNNNGNIGAMSDSIAPATVTFLNVYTFRSSDTSALTDNRFTVIIF